MKNLLSLFIAAVLFTSCATTSKLVRGDDPLIITAVVEGDQSKYVVEAYGVDGKHHRQYIAFQTDVRYSIGDTLWIKK